MAKSSLIEQNPWTKEIKVAGFGPHIFLLGGFLLLLLIATYLFWEQITLILFLGITLIIIGAVIFLYQE